MQADDDSQCGSGPHFLPISSAFRLAIWIDVLVGAQCSNVNWWRHIDVCDAKRFGQEIYIPTCYRPDGHILVYSRDPSQTDIHTHYLPPLYVSADTHGTHGMHGTHAKFVHCSKHCILPIIYFPYFFFRSLLFLLKFFLFYVLLFLEIYPSSSASSRVQCKAVIQTCSFLFIMAVYYDCFVRNDTASHSDGCGGGMIEPAMSLQRPFTEAPSTPAV